MAATGPNNSPQTTKDSTSTNTAAAMVKEPIAAAAKSTEEVTKKTQQDDTTNNMKPCSTNATTTVTPAAAPPSTSKSSSSSTPPNYFSTKSSKAYTLAYKLLNSDNFQDALSTLETALEFTVQILRADHNNNHHQTAAQQGNDDEEEDCMELHESLAPLYYLYGSTLLYSVEESDVMMASSSQQPPAGGVPDDTHNDSSSPPDYEVGNQQEEEGSELMNKNDEYDEEEQSPPPQESPSSSDPTEDLQIAWENLETARSIVTKLVESFHPLGEIIASGVGGGKSEYSSSSNKTTTSTYTAPKEQSDLLLDLAQIHTRLGDLQRGNNSVANTSDCISDYTTALKLRTKVLGRYHKKVADSYYSLAGVYAEAPSKGGEEVEDAVERFVSQLDDGNGDGGGGTKGMTESEKMEYRERSLENFVECAVSFSGMLASMCGEDADVLTDLSNTKSAASTSASASTNDGCGVHSTMLSTLRSRVSNLTPPTKSPEKETFEDIKEMLDEIQEAVDTAEEAEEGLRTLGVMKANEIRKHEAKKNGEQGGEMEEKEVDNGGGMTTIGFGVSVAAAASGKVNVFGAASSTTAAAAAASSSTSVNAFGNGASAATSAAKPMMIVKKKKKKVQPVLLDADSAKRSKTE